MEADLRSAIDHGKMSRFQIGAVAICVALNMLDGFDVLVMAFTAPSVSSEWSLSGAQLGVLLSAGLFGMTAGSLLIAPFADRFGRRAVILGCLAVMTVGMLASAFAQTTIELAALRAVTGLGIGAMLASVNVITAEYASNKWRSTAISVQGTGYPIGATVGGTIAAFLIESQGWRSVFVFGAAVSALLIPVVVFALPESLDFLVSRRPRGALRQVNRLLSRMGQRPVLELPAAGPAATERRGFSRLFTAELRRSTLTVASVFFLLMFCFYFVLSWTPKLLVEAGLSKQEGITGGVLLNLGGIVGGLAFGYAAAFLDLRKLTASCLFAAGLSLSAFGAASGQLGPAFVVAIGIGFVLFSSMIGMYALTPTLYDASVRTTGMGFAIGIGRFGAIASPASVGILLDAGVTGPQLYFAFTVPLLAAAALTWLGQR